jgi:Protein of unknown function (DUF4232)
VLLIGVVLVCVGAPSARSADPLPVCRTGELRLAATFLGAAGGQFSETFTFTNTWQRVCRLSGWPEVGILDRTGRRVMARTVRVVQNAPPRHPFRTIGLRPRGHASFDVYGADWDFAANRPCARTAAVLVTPPGTRQAIIARAAMPNCGRFYVAPIVAGRADRQAWSVVWRG